MAMSEESRKNVLNNVLHRVLGVSDKEYQKRVWIKGIGPECDDFDETSEYILGDGPAILEEAKHLRFTDYQYNSLKTFIDEYEAFGDNPSLGCCMPELFLDTPEWTKITELAAEVIKAFDYHYTFPSC
jgi:hypothetical protein